LVYALLIIPRLVFPQTIVIGRRKTQITMIAAVIELGLNIPLSLLMIKWGYGIVGVALATFIVYCVSKIYLAAYLWVKLKIKPSEYIPLKAFLVYSLLTTVVFLLVDRRIIDIQ
ncbi:MAG TPA: polysaccharide biosynthesis C-terminal domain-containing protein, partial [Bacteroidales bacterium]|nr:polysaccharide biosynthesis C-terminal domain-containing protein [Bacteroidales bacterium]